MKKIIFTILSGILFCLSLNAQEKSGDFYYCFEKKIFLEQRADKVYLKFDANVSRDQFFAVVSSNPLLQTESDKNLDAMHQLGFVILEATDGKQISRSNIEFYKAKPEIVSANFLFQYGKTLQGLTDEFVVKLKRTTSYAQLQTLAEQNNCTIGKENQFEKNEFMITVSKVSLLNAIQMANFFYETGLFEFSSPNFTTFKASHSNDPYFSQQWGLKNTATSGVDIKAEQAWTITQGSPNIKIAVGAVGSNGQRSNFSNYGTALDVVAPGVNIYTTDIQGSGGAVSGDYYCCFTGTSASSPFVAGIAALVLSANPNLRYYQVRNIIESTAQKTGGYTYSTTSGRANGTWNNQVGYGLVNAYAAVQAACPNTFTNQTVIADKIVTACTNLSVQNVTVSNGAKLKLEAPGEIIINGDFEIQLGSELEIK